MQQLRTSQLNLQLYPHALSTMNALVEIAIAGLARRMHNDATDRAISRYIVQCVTMSIMKIASE